MSTPNDLLLAPDPPRIKRDRWERYLIPHPETGVEQAWTRATTVAGVLADRFGLERWDQRNIAWGIGKRHDLYAQAAAATLGDYATLSGICEAAKEAAAAASGRNLGSALHRFTERLDWGEDVKVPEPWADDIYAYRETMLAHGIAVIGGWVERIVLVPELGVAGTTDRLCNAMSWPLPRIADLKTSKHVLDYGVYEIALQLALYAHATHWFDPATSALHPMPPVDQEWALVMQLIPGQGECTLIEIDIAAGWEAVQLAMAVREWRKREDLAVVVNAAGGQAEVAPSASGADEGGGAEAAGQGTDTPDAATSSGTAPPSQFVGAGEEPIREDGSQATPEATSTPQALVSPAGPVHISPAPIFVGSPSADVGASSAKATDAPAAVHAGVAPVAEGLGEPILHASTGPAGQEEGGLVTTLSSDLFERRYQWVRGRIATIVTAGHAEHLAGIWPDGVPTFKQGGPRNAEELEQVNGVCMLVEAFYTMPFPLEPDPTIEPMRTRKKQTTTRKGKR